MKKKFITLSTLAILMTSCGLSDSLNETKLNAQMANENSKCIKEMNEDKFFQMGQSGAAKVRSDNWLLAAPGISGMGAKLEKMAIYMKAQDFALQSAVTCGKTETDDESSYLNAAKEFTRKMNDLVAATGSGDIKISDLFSEDSDDVDKGALEAQKVFAAYAATMHEVSDFRKVIEKRKGKKNIKHLTMLDLIQDTLRIEKRVEAGEVSLAELKPHEMELGDSSNKQVMLKLLNTRYNFLTALATKFLVNMKDEATLMRAQQIGMSLAQGKPTEVKLPTIVDGVNTISRAKISKYLTNALKAKNTLIELGAESHLKLDKDLQFVLTFLDINTDDSVILDDDKVKVTAQSQRKDIKELITSILPEIKKAPVKEISGKTPVEVKTESDVKAHIDNLLNKDLDLQSTGKASDETLGLKLNEEGHYTLSIANQEILSGKFEIDGNTLRLNGLAASADLTGASEATGPGLTLTVSEDLELIHPKTGLPVSICKDEILLLNIKSEKIEKNSEIEINEDDSFVDEIEGENFLEDNIPVDACLLENGPDCNV